MVAITMWQLANASLVTIALLQSTAGAQITNDTYFYGQSPPVYPSPNAPGASTWAAAHAKAVALVNKMTIEEKSNITTGYTPSRYGCSGMTGAVTRLGFPGMCLHDAGNGVKNTDFVNAWPSGLHAGASWNRELTYDRGLYMGGEFKTKGVNVAMGPVVGPLGRIAADGRTWEGFASDPYLSGQLAAETVQGLQDAGVIATIKHFIGNEQELNRMPAGLGASISSNIDDKTLHELYLAPFADALHAGVASVMCAYTGVNNSYSCQNSKLLNGILKTELGFEGFVVSDWGAQYTGLAGFEAGMDIAMPTSIYNGVNGAILTTMVQNGSLPESRLTDMAVRLLSSWYHLGQESHFPVPGIGMGVGPLLIYSNDYYSPQVHINARNPAAKGSLLSGAMEGHVLVKNVGNALPLKAPKLLSVFGYDAPSVKTWNVPGPTDFLGGLCPDGWELLDSSYIPFVSAGPLPQYGAGGTQICGGGSGANSPAYISAPFDAIKEQAYVDGTSLLFDFESQEPIVDSASDACLVFINAFASEGYDRSSLVDTYSDTLVKNVAASCNNTIVTIHNAGIAILEDWIDLENVTAVIYGHLPGQDSGRALVQLMYGVQSFSGKLPYTVAKDEADYINAGQPVSPPTEGDYVNYPQANFTEGVYIDYKYFDANNITPRYEFGFGLTYTTFSYSKLSMHLSGASTARLPPSSAVVQGGPASLWSIVATVTAQIKNTGKVDAMEIAQLYIGIPGGPVRELRGFEKAGIAHGHSVTVSFDLTRKDLSIWDVKEQKWVLQAGNYAVYVGSSSRTLPLTGTLKIKN